MAENILASASGFVYRLFSGTGALLDPAAELGDAVRQRRYPCSQLWIPLRRAVPPDISAPADEEVDHEHLPTKAPQAGSSGGR